MQQQGLGALVPGMAQGGPVAFQFGGLLADPRSGVYPKESDEDRKRKAAERLAQVEQQLQNPNLPGQASAILATEAANLRKEVAPEQPKPAPAKEQPKPAEQGADINSLIAQLAKLQQAQQQPAAAAPVDLKGLEKLAAAFMPAQVPVMSMEERRKQAEEEEKYLKQKFPDTVSPLADQLAAEVGQQVSPEEAKRRAFMKAGIAGLGYTGRDFGAGLAGMLEGYEGTRQSVEAANKEAKTLALKARLANEQYKDAIKRKDYESARKYADEAAEIQAAQVEAQNKAKLGKLGVMGAMQDLMTPKKAAGATSGMPKFGDAARIRKDAVEAAQPELRDLEKRYDEESSRFHSALGFGKRGTSWRNDPKEMANFESEKENIIQKYERRLYPTVGADQGVTTLTPQMMEAIREYVKKQSGK
jgi:hypothetical protein